jgi:hypothetical protein
MAFGLASSSGLIPFSLASLLIVLKASFISAYSYARSDASLVSSKMGLMVLT